MVNPANDWWTCDGNDHVSDSDNAPRPFPVRSTPALPRRILLAGALTAGVAWAARAGVPPSALSELALRPDRSEPEGDVLVTIFLRGGADGLNIVAPHGEDAYHRNRPTIGLAAPTKRANSGSAAALDLDGFFGFHPALAPLLPFYQDGTLAVVHACGSGDDSRSHFEAMATMERGQPGDRKRSGHGDASGWLARHLSSAPSSGNNASPLRAVAFASTLPDSLRGVTQVTTLSSLADFRLRLPDVEKVVSGRTDANTGVPEGATPPGDGAASAATRHNPALREALAGLYQPGIDIGDDVVAQAGRETLAVLDTLHRIDPAGYRPAGGAAYPQSDLGAGLRQVACLIKGGVGLEVACLDRGGWDTHVAQGGATGWLAAQLADVAGSLAAFARDLGPERMRHVTVLVMTEFGRRVQENSGLGTDHGRASVLFLLGGGINGGKVFARWPGLEPHQLDPTSDLRVTSDYRDVLAEIAAKRLRNGHAEVLFPGHTPRLLGIAKPVA